jgi:3-oxoacyl-[acyl-carrier protein] reductase
MKVILITGVSRGIGNTLAKHFLKKNYRVIGLGRSCPTDINYQSLFRFIPCDLLDSEQIKEALLLLDTESIDVFIHGAMYTPKHAPFIRYKESDFVNAHFIATVVPILIIQKIAMGMKNRGHGQILFLGSLIQKMGSKGQLAYLTAKSALSGLTTGLAVELGQYGISTNLFLLGAVETEKLKENLGEDRLEKLKNQLTYKRLIQAESIAESIESFIQGPFSILANGSEIILSDTQHLRGGDGRG